MTAVVLVGPPIAVVDVVVGSPLIVAAFDLLVGSPLIVVAPPAAAPAAGYLPAALPMTPA